MAAVNPPDFLQNAGSTHNAEPLRTVIGGLMAGVTATNSMKSAGGIAQLLGNALKVQATGSPSMSVDILNGVIYVPGTEGANQGIYGCVNDATVNLAIAASNPTNPRIDIAVAKVQDSQYSGVTNTWSLAIVTGTPAGSPSPPAAPANSIILAQIAVAANATSIVNGNITDKRPYVAGVGGQIACTSTTRPSWVASGVGGGQQIYETDTGRFYYWDQTNALWRPESGWELIQEIPVSVATPTLTFSSIPQYFKDLRLTLVGRTTEAVNFSDVLMKLNNDTGSNYAMLASKMSQGGEFALDEPDTSAPLAVFQIAGASFNANVSGSGIAECYGYSDSSRSNKIFFSQTGVGDFGNAGHFRHRMNSWANGGGSQTPTALTRIDLTAAGSSNFSTVTVARLYGWRL